jgi:hypothetical protein
MKTSFPISWIVFAAASSPVLSAAPDTVAEPKLSVHSAIVQLRFKFEPPPSTEDVPGIFTRPPPIIEMQASLPAFEVVAPRSKLTEDDVATDKLRAEQAIKKYTSPAYLVTFGLVSQVAGYVLNPLSIFHHGQTGEAEAMLLRDQDIRLERLDEANRLIHLDAIGNPDAVRDDVNTERDLFVEGRATGR